ncbi:MAG: TIR domain-containing protein [Planctomycetota bacterium]
MGPESSGQKATGLRRLWRWLAPGYRNRSGSKYDLFLSYARSDSEDAKRLKRSFEKAFKNPFAYRGMRVFRDETSLGAGPLPSAIQAALAQSDTLVVVASPASGRSTWVRREVREFCRSRRKQQREPRICVVLVAGRTPWTDDRDAIGGEELAVDRHYARAVLGGVVEEPAVQDLRACRDERGRLRRQDATYKNAIAAVASTVWGVEKDELHGAEVARASTLRRIAGVVAVLLLALFVRQQVNDRREARKLEIQAAFDAIETEGSAIATERLRALGFDPVLAQHKRFEEGLDHDVETREVIELHGLASWILIARDGTHAAIGYDDQNYGGQPDLEDLEDATWAEVIELATGERTHVVLAGSDLGQEYYFETPSDFLLPDTLVFDRGDGAIHVSLGEESETVVERATGREQRVSEASLSDLPEIVEERLDLLLDPENLYLVHPDDGIDVEYGPRFVDSLIVASPTGRSVVVGTYEGSLELVDLRTGRSRHVGGTGSIYASAYGPGGRLCFVCDADVLWEVTAETATPGLRELALPLHRTASSMPGRELVLAVAADATAEVLALVTRERLFVLRPEGMSTHAWSLPERIEAVAALGIDTASQRVDVVVADDGRLLSVEYVAAASELVDRGSPMNGAPVVAWLEPAQRRAWIAAAVRPLDSARVREVSLDTGRVEREATVPLQELEAWREAKLHALFHGDDTLVLFRGEGVFSDTELMSEEMWRVPWSDPESPARHELFEVSSIVDNLGEEHWDCDRVAEILPGSRADRLRIRTKLGRRYAVAADGTRKPLAGSLAYQEVVDGAERYGIRVEADGHDAVVHATSAAREVDVRYTLPWIFNRRPGSAASSRGAFAAIGKDGQRVVLVERDGRVAIVDL